MRFSLTDRQARARHETNAHTRDSHTRTNDSWTEAHMRMTRATLASITPPSASNAAACSPSRRRHPMTTCASAARERTQAHSALHHVKDRHGLQGWGCSPRSFLVRICFHSPCPVHRTRIIHRYEGSRALSTCGAPRSITLQSSPQGVSDVARKAVSHMGRGHARDFSRKCGYIPTHVLTGYNFHVWTTLTRRTGRPC